MATDVGSIIARLILDRSPFTDSLNAARADAAKGVDVKVSLDSKRFDAEWARVMAMKAALGGETDARAGLKGAAPLEIPVRYALDRSGLILPKDLATEAQSPLIPLLLGAGGGAGGGGGGNRTIDIFHHADNSGGGGGTDFGAISSALLFGGGSKIPFLGTMAGLGSLASFAGLGPEHVIMTALGLAGSAAGGILGGGLLGLGSLGTAAVGMGTDMAGIGQAAGDIKTVTTDMNALSRAVAVYGKGSTQAANAQKQLNYDLAGFSPVAKTAVVAAAQQVQTFKSLFDVATGPAEKIGAGIINQAIQVGEQFLPTVGQYAARNMGIIQSSLQPLFAWIKGPEGMGIFNTLEAKFSSELPTAMHAFTQGFEFVAKTIGYVSQLTGGLLPKIDAFLTKMNTTQGFAKWTSFVDKMIADFHLWTGLIKAAGRDIYDLFSNDAGTASGIVSSLTTMLNKLGDWERSTQGKAALHNIFQTHKQEILDLLNLLPSLASSMGSIYLKVAPALTSALTTVLGAIAPVLKVIASNPVGAWMLGLILIAGRLGILKPLLAPVTSALAGLAGAVGGAALSNLKSFAQTMGILILYGWEKLIGGLRGAAAAMWGFTFAADANPVGAIILGLVLLGAALVLLVTHWRAVTSFLHGEWGTAISIAIAVIMPMIGIPMLIIGHWSAIVGFFTGMWSAVSGAFVSFWHTIDNDVIHPLEDMPHAMMTAFGVLTGFFSTLWHGIEQIFGQAGAMMIRGFQLLANGVFTMVEAVLSAASHLPFVGHYFAEANSTVKGFQADMNSTLSSLASQMASWGTSAGAGMAGNLAAAITNYGAAAIGAAQAVAAGVGSALRSAEASAAAGAASIASTAAQAVASAAAAEQAVAKAASLNGAASVTGHATGTRYFSGGLTWVGEQGPELMALPRGTQIVPNRKSMDMAGGGGITLNDNRRITVQADSGASAAAISQAVCKELDKHDQQLLSHLERLAGANHL